MITAVRTSDGARVFIIGPATGGVMIVLGDGSLQVVAIDTITVAASVLERLA